MVWSRHLWRGSRRGVRTAALEVKKLHSKAWEAHVRSQRWRAARAARQALELCCRVPGLDALLHAGLWYVLGASSRRRSSKSRGCLQRSLKILQGGGKGNHSSLLRMQAEVQLRLKSYAAAFGSFRELASMKKDEEELYVSPFRLRHDLALPEKMVALGRLDGTSPAALRQVLTLLEEEDTAEPWCVRFKDLPVEVRCKLREGRYDGWSSVCPYPADRERLWEAKDPLRLENPWHSCVEEFRAKGLVVIDHFFSLEGLAELWTYALEAPCFRSLRPGYLGAFPADGCVHPIIRRVAESLEEKMPAVLERHHLTRWWLFKYFSCGSSGIGIHADDAAVNVNIWLTPDQACRRGGGLDIYRSVPPPGSWTGDHNRVSGNDMDGWRQALAQGGVDHVKYKQNRACIFVSDRFHESEPFDFDEKLPRVNLTLLFGDRRDVKT